MDVEARRAIKLYSKEARVPLRLLFFEINANVVTKEKEKKRKKKEKREKKRKKKKRRKKGKITFSFRDSEAR